MVWGVISENKSNHINRILNGRYRLVIHMPVVDGEHQGSGKTDNRYGNGLPGSSAEDKRPYTGSTSRRLL